MIQSFGDEATRDVFLARDTRSARAIPAQLWPIVRRKLAMVDAAVTVPDLRVPPGNRLEQLNGNRAGEWSIRVNERYRITFRLEDGSATDVTCEDYH